MIKALAKILLTLIFLLVLWQALIWLSQAPDYFLPRPWQVMKIFIAQPAVLFTAAMTTLLEALLGFLLALISGCFAALVLFHFRPMHLLFWPVLLISQAVPTLAIAPLLVLWLGYGLSSKIVLVAIMLFFPITSAFLDGLRQTNPIWLSLANLMTQNRLAILWHIQVPAALPHLASGVRIAAAGALIGAVVGEWVGANQGLGFLLLEANARFQTALMFAAIISLIILSLLFFKTIELLLKKLINF